MSSKGINSKVILQANAQWNYNDSCILDDVRIQFFFWVHSRKKNSYLLSCCNYLQHLTFDIKYDCKVIILYQHYLLLKSGNLSALRLVTFSAYITFLEFTVNRHDLIYRDITHYKKWVNKEGIEPQNILRALSISLLLF